MEVRSAKIPNTARAAIGYHPGLARSVISAATRLSRLEDIRLLVPLRNDQRNFRRQISRPACRGTACYIEKVIPTRHGNFSESRRLAFACISIRSSHHSLRQEFLEIPANARFGHPQFALSREPAARAL